MSHNEKKKAKTAKADPEELRKASNDEELNRLIQASMDNLISRADDWDPRSRNWVCFDMPGTDRTAVISVEKSRIDDGWLLCPGVTGRGSDRLVSNYYESMGKEKLLKEMRSEKMKKRLKDSLTRLAKR